MERLAKVFIIFGAVALNICSCGGNSSSAPVTPIPKLTEGNWFLVEDSSVFGGTHPELMLGGMLSATGATMLPIGLNSSTCFPPQTPTASPLTFTGTTSGANATFTWPGNNQLLTITAQVNPNNTIVGTYVEAGGVGCAADNGTVYGTLVPALTGSWGGTLPAQAGTSHSASIPATTIAATLSQASDLSTDTNNNATVSRFPLSGTLTLTNPCLSSGSASLTIDDTASFIVGDQVLINTLPAQDGTVLALRAGTLVDPTVATAVTFQDYAVSGGLCTFADSTPINITKSS